MPALAHRLTLRPGALGAARARRRPRARGARVGAHASRRGMTSPRLGEAHGLAKLGAYAGLSRARPARRARPRPARARRSRRAVRPRPLRRPRARARAGLRRRARRSTASAPSRATRSTLEIELEARTPIERLELHARRSARRSRSSDGANPVDAAARPSDETRTLELKVRCNRWGAYSVGEIFLRAHDRLDALRLRGNRPARRALKVYPRAEQLRSLIAPARDAGVHGQPGRARRRAKASSSPTCGRFEATAIRAADQLARERAARRARG